MSSIYINRLESHQWRYASGAIVNCLSGDSLTLAGEDRVVIGPRRDEDSTNQRWILTTSGLVVAKGDVSARIIVGGGGEGGKPEVTLTRAVKTEDERKKEKEGFYFHVILEPEEVNSGQIVLNLKMRLGAGENGAGD